VVEFYVDTLTTALGSGTATAADSNNANTDVVVDGDVWKARPPPGVKRAPILVTVAVLKCPTSATTAGNHQHGLPIHVLIVNPTLEEEACAYCLVHVAVVSSDNDHGNKKNVCACQKTGRGSLPVPLLPEIMATALAATGPTQKQYQIKQPSSQQQ
jgi:exosome complex RNA-binding protein Rrp42 (RNase PH superfamily)